MTRPIYCGICLSQFREMIIVSYKWKDRKGGLLKEWVNDCPKKQRHRALPKS